TPPRDAIEEKLVEIWSGVLAIPGEKIAIDANFFQLGGHSLKATILLAQIHKELDVRLPVAEIFKRPTIRRLAEYFEKAVRERFISIKPAEEKEYYVLSSAQARLFILQQFDPQSTAYNVNIMVRLQGKTQKERLQDAFRQLIARHDSLRTSFGIHNGKPRQRIYRYDKDPLEFEIEYHGDISSPGEVEHIARQFVRAFDFAKAPLLRVALVKVEPLSHVLMVDMPHIVTDAVSHEILMHDFAVLYNGGELAPLDVRYKDYAQWEQSRSTREMLKKQEKYWLTAFAGDLPVLSLPYDFPRPPSQRFEGDTLDFGISVEETKQLNEISRFHGATQFMVLLAVYNILLSKLSSREDIVVGVPIAGRRHADLEQIIGMFVNTLALRNTPSAGKSFTQFLEDVKTRTVDAYDNQDYPFEELVEKVTVERDLSRDNPLFDALFDLQNVSVPEAPGEAEAMEDIKPEPFDFEIRETKFDLLLYALESNGRILFSFRYSTRLFREETISRFIRYFKTIISAVIDFPQVNVSDIDVITEEEKNKLLYEFNQTEAGYPEDKTIHGLFTEQVERTPDHTALIAPDLQSVDMTYRELNERSHHVAYVLNQKGVEFDTIVGIMLDRSVEMIVGILGILKAGGVYMPIDPDYPPERVDFMLRDSGAKVLVSTEEVKCEIATVLVNPMEPLPNSTYHDQRLTFPASKPSDLAYVIYTSGTTGKPKGVLVEHRNVVRLMVNDKFQFDFSSEDIWTLFHSYCFDFSVWEMYGALLYGGKLVIIPGEVARDTRKFLEVLKSESVTVLNQTPLAFYNLAELESREPGSRLNLRYVIFGGDALKPARLKEWKAAYPHTRLINMYGITETTVHVTFKEIKDDDISGKISNIGQPIPTLSTYSLSPYLTLHPIGVPGECCVGGDGVARGYLNRPGLTAERFIENPYKPGETLYRSGDLVKVSSNGEMEHLGRIDHQVKIRGFRIELGEIENRLLELESISKAAVIDQTGPNGEKYLCAYIIPVQGDVVPVRGELQVSQIKTALSGKLPDYMVPSYFVELETIPLTPNGKIDRKALTKLDTGFDTGEEYIAPRDRLESELVEIWREVLGLEDGQVGMTANFFESGGHSLNAITLVSLIHKTFKVKIPLAEVFTNPGIGELAQVIKGLAEDEDKYASIEPSEEREYYPLSSAQERLYILRQMDPQSTAYNMPHVIPLSQDHDVEKIETVFVQLIRRHDSLRTSFRMIHETPVQQVHDADSVEFNVGLVMEGVHNQSVSFVRPFDLSRAPLLRAALAGGGSSRPVLLVDMHHIITDGLSLDILRTEFFALYRGGELPELRLRYKDFSQWQNSEIQADSFKRQETYWLNQFQGEPPLLMLPLDFPRPAVQEFDGHSVDFELPAGPTGLLKQLAGTSEVTLYMLLLSVFNILLSKVTGQEDIIIGTPIAARRHPDLARIIGMFVNTIALRNNPGHGKSFKQFLEDVKTRTLESFENQEYPFETLVDKISIPRDVSRNPLFDVMFVYQNLDADLGYAAVANGANGEQSEKEDRRYIPQVSKFDLTLTGLDAGETLVFSLQYRTKLFKPGTVERFTGYFRRLLTAVTHDADALLSGLEIISGEEKKRILVEFNDTRRDFPSQKTIPQLFSEQVERTPGLIALTGQTTTQNLVSLTYSQLDRQTDRLAGLLRENGVAPDTIVGIMVERSIEMIIGVMGIMKAGGAYLPIDP
ncbi:MAG: amino acid adenylation domain-containing protein, partial [bacterium]|nr:amino acid adenylation domain-containing protein [bacterium]